MNHFNGMWKNHESVDNLNKVQTSAVEKNVNYALKF